MPVKRSEEVSQFEKLFYLFELFFLRAPREWTIRELMERFERIKGWECAPNTIRNLIQDLKKAMGEKVIEERRRGKRIYYYPTVRFQTKKPGDISNLSLMDYTRHSFKIETLMRALNENMLCTVRYQALSGKEKEHLILPLRAVSHHDVIYVYAWRYPGPEVLEKEEDLISGKFAPGYPFLLTFHRIKSIYLFRKKTGEFVRIEQYAPEQAEFLKTLAERCFGLIKKEKFRVRVRFDKSVEMYLKERKWSDDEEYPAENELVFSATSRPEVKSWVLSFGKNLILLEPEDLRKEIIEELESILSRYRELQR